MGNTDNARYVAYISSYTVGSKDPIGIRIYDVDMEKGRLYEKEQIRITNSSYVTISHDQRFLYSITDFGVEAYRIEKDGGLTSLGMAGINGMRGSYLSTDYTDRWLFVAGYHDGKITVLSIREDGSLGEITDEVYHKALASVTERNFHPHVQCVKMTRDNRFLCVADLGMDMIKVYSLDTQRGKIRPVDILHCDVDSAPRHIKFSGDGRFLYVVMELQNAVRVYSYRLEGDEPVFEEIQEVPTLNAYHASGSISSALNISEDYKYLVSSTAGDNSVTLYRIDAETGLLDKIFCLPVSGDYPKDAALFPDDRHLVSLNHESGTLTFFTVDPEAGTLVMNGPELRIDQPNCIIFHRLKEA